MTPAYDEYHRAADHCRKMAERTQDPILKRQWLCLTAKWLSLISAGDKRVPREAEFASSGENGELESAG